MMFQVRLLNREFLLYGFINIVFIANALCAQGIGDGPEPRQVALRYGTEDLVPIITYDVTEAPYSADKTGQSDATASFAQALKDAEETGGTVFAPEGRYRVEGNLSIPRGVTLRGDWKKPTDQDVKVGGTLLLAFAGRGDVQGKPFISADEGGARDLTIFYPEQKAPDVVPYPTTVHLVKNAAIKNITLVNSYRGVLTGGFSTVMNLYGTTLNTGLTMLQAAAVPRCRYIKLSPRYWSESGLEAAPKLSELTKTLIDMKSFGIQLNRQDAGIFIDVDIEGYHTGVKFMPPHGWTYWYDIDIKDVEVGVHFSGGSHHRMYITNSSINANTYGVLMKMDNEGWDSDWAKLSKSGRPFGLANDQANLRMYNCRFNGVGTNIFMDGSYRQVVNLQECAFESWGDGDNHYAIDSVNGSLDIYDSVFKNPANHIRYQGEGVRKGRGKDKNSRYPLIHLVGNQFAGSPDLNLPNQDLNVVDHTISKNLGKSPPEIKDIPDRLPARVGPKALYVATNAPFGVSSNGTNDVTQALQRVLNQAGKDGGGTVYLPQGRYRLTKPIRVPSGVELRGVNDFMPRGVQSRTLIIADIKEDRGKPDNTPFIRLESSQALGGSGIAGLAIWYPHQSYKDVKPYPWTIQGMGPRCWVQRVFLGNCYNAIDFATHDSDQHVISRVCGSALNIAFKVGKSKTIGWIDNCHIRPQDWTLSSSVEVRHKSGKLKRAGFVFEIPGDADNKPSTKQVFRGTEYSLIPNLRGAGAITIGSGANEQITAFFTNGATRAFDFVDHDGTGGGNANILIGGSEAGWGAWIKALGDKGVSLVNFSFNPMTRLPYAKPEDIPAGNLQKGLVMQIEPTVSKQAPITMVQPKFYGRKDIDVGVRMKGASIFLKQGMVESQYGKATFEVNGGEIKFRNTESATVTGSAYQGL
ncbi:MAG: glycosyl hydrolase family 28-related protein [Verrucomicrobiota bacterium]